MSFSMSRSFTEIVSMMLMNAIFRYKKSRGSIYNTEINMYFWNKYKDEEMRKQ